MKRKETKEDTKGVVIGYTILEELLNVSCSANLSWELRYWIGPISVVLKKVLSGCLVNRLQVEDL